MQCISNVETELDKVLNKFTNFSDHVDEKLRDLIAQIESFKESLQDPNGMYCCL